MDIVNAPPEYKDFFGVRTTNAGVAKIQCPILAFYGSTNDIADEKALELLRSCIQKQPKGPTSVTTAIIQRADHMFMGEEQQVCGVITNWVENAVNKSNTRP